MISKYDTLKKDIFRLNEDEEFYKAYYRAGHSSEVYTIAIRPRFSTDIIFLKLYLCIMGLVRKISEQTENIFRMAM